MVQAISFILWTCVLLLANADSSLNPPPNNAPPSPVSNAAQGNSMVASSDKPEGASSDNNQQPNAAPLNSPNTAPNNNNINGAPALVNKPLPNTNDQKPNENTQQVVVPNNPPGANGNNALTNSNSASPNNSGGLNNGVQPNSGFNNAGTATTKANSENGLNHQNLSGTNHTNPGSVKDIHHPIGNSAKQTQNHPKQTGNINKGHKNGATAVSLMSPMNIFMAGFIPFLINFCL